MKTIEELELLETIETIVEYKMKQAHKEQKEYEHFRDDAQTESDKKVWDNSASRALAKWSAYNDIFEAIQLYK